MGMDVRGVANNTVQIVNDDVYVTVQRSSGYVIDAATLKQVPAYETSAVILAQVQPVSTSDLQQYDSLNLQTIQKALYINGQLRGLSRPELLGGDLVVIGSQTWLVYKVLESWSTWSKAVITLQGGGT